MTGEYDLALGGGVSPKIFFFLALISVCREDGEKREKEVMAH